MHIHLSLCYSLFCLFSLCFILFYDPSLHHNYTLSLHDALPISGSPRRWALCSRETSWVPSAEASLDSVCSEGLRSEEHTSELQSRGHLVCRLLHEKKKNITNQNYSLLLSTHKIVVKSSLQYTQN